MDFYGLDKDQAIDNCDSFALGRNRDTQGICAWNRVRPEHVVDLLDQAAPEARGDARNLAVLMSRFAWRIHDGSEVRSGNQRIVNNVREITVSLAGRNFQLHCTENPALRLERITA